MSENLARTYKLAETKKQIEELLDNAKKDIMQNYIEKALDSGALSASITAPNNYLLAKFIITAYFDKGPYSPLNPIHKKELKNLELFL